MNERVNRDYLDSRYGSGRSDDERLPKLTPDVVVGSPDRVQLTIMDATAFRRGTLVRLRFREYPRNILWAARADALTAANQLGEDDVARWAGRMLWLDKVRRNDPRKRCIIEKYVPAPPMRGDAEPEPAARRMRPRRYQ